MGSKPGATILCLMPARPTSWWTYVSAALIGDLVLDSLFQAIALSPSLSVKMKVVAPRGIPKVLVGRRYFAPPKGF